MAQGRLLKVGNAMQWNDALEQIDNRELTTDTSHSIHTPLGLRELLLKWQSLWHKLWRDYTRREDGASVVIFSIVVVLLMGLGGLAVDASNIYLHNQRMQIAADAAAFGGTRMLARNATRGEIDAEIYQLAVANHADSATWTYINAKRGVRVLATRQLDAYFARIYGQESFTVNAQAGAQFELVTGTGNLMPFTVVCNPWDKNGKVSADPTNCQNGLNFQYGVEYTLHESKANASGNFGWIRWNEDGTDAPTLEYNINHPEESPVLQIGDWIKGTTGNDTSVFPALDQWIGEPVIIPIYDKVTGTGSNAQYRIYAFGVFELTKYSKSNKTIAGKFMRKLVHGISTNVNGSDFGARDVRLVE